MGVYEQNVKRFRRLRPKHADYEIRVMGRLNADGTLDTDLTAGLDATYVWVHDPDNRITSRVKNLRVENAPGMRVEVARNTHSGELEIMGVDPLSTPLAYGEAAAALNSPRKGSIIPTPTTGRDIVTGGLYLSTTGGLNVIVTAFQHLNGYWTGVTEKLLTPTATAGSKALNCIGIDLYANAYIEVLTQNRNDSITSMHPQDVYAAIAPYPTVLWTGAVELANGATSIDPSKFLDLRLWRLPTAIAQTGALIQMYRLFH